MRLRTSSLTKQHRNVPHMMLALFYLAFVVWLTGLVIFFLQIWLGYRINSEPGMSKFGPSVSLLCRYVWICLESKNTMPRLLQITHQLRLQGFHGQGFPIGILRTMLRILIF